MAPRFIVVSSKMGPKGQADAVESVRIFNPPRNIVVKQAVIREVRSMQMSCDRIGNLLLTRFAFTGSSKDALVFIPASIVFWLLEHMPVNQDPQLQPPPVIPPISREEWFADDTPRALTVQCKQFADALRMSFDLDNRKEKMTVLMNRSNVELLRQMLVAYSKDLINLDA
jgi:hypothetical protein